MTSPLFAPITLGGITLPNRIAVSPMCQYSAVKGVPQPWHVQHLGALSLSGAGLLILEATAVEPVGRITHGCLGLYDDGQEHALAELVGELRTLGGQARLGIQIGHAGRKASSRRPWEGGQALEPTEAPWPIVGPSPLPFGTGRPVPAELDQAGLDRIRDAFVAAARRADRVGFDLVELHGAHGYLLHSFMSPVSNQRSDRYGGSLEGRLRFPLEIAEAVRAVWPKSKALGMRMTGSDWVEGGLTPADAQEMARRLEAAGLDYVCVSSGGVAADVKVAVGPGYQVPFAEAVKQAVTIPVMAVGLIAEPAQANAVLTEGRADMVALARGFLDNPRWGWHAAKALGAEIEYPPQYRLSRPGTWPGYPIAHGASA
jgi:NADPH2 dehydrogenase